MENILNAAAAPQPAVAAEAQPVDKRAAFEAWLAPPWSRERCIDMEGDEVYAESWVQGAWMCWQARSKPSQDPKIEHRHVLAITTAYEQGVGKGHYAIKHGKEVSNPYAPEWGCDIAWQLGYAEGKEQAEVRMEWQAEDEALTATGGRDELGLDDATPSEQQL